MDKAKKKQIKRIIACVCAAAVVALLAAMPLIARQEQENDGPQASILNGTVTPGTIDTALIGGGTLAEEDALSIQIPSAVKLTGFLVSNGETVTEGTAIATVDRVSVMQAITEVQDTLEYLSEQIEEAGDSDSEVKLTALAGGTVKHLYVSEGDLVQDVMLEHGALAVLSLDGLMAVDLETDSGLAAGTTVVVTLPEGTETTGRIETNLAGRMTVTVEDEGYSDGASVTVKAQDGTEIGSGELYIYSPWNATAYTGTVDTIKADVGDDMDPGDTLMVLSDVGYSAAYLQLVGQRQQYEDLMLELFRMYQTETVTAPSDGIVSGIDENSLQLLADQGGSLILQFLINAPNGDDEHLYTNYIARMVTIGQNGWELIIDPESVKIDDYKTLAGFQLNPDQLTEMVQYDPAPVYNGVVPVYELENDQWKQVDATQICEGDLLLFAADDQGEFVWIVRMEKNTPETPPEPTEPSEPEIPSEPTVPTEPENPGDPTVPTEPENPGDPTVPTEPENPGDPTNPSEPVNPGEPGNPGQPENPSDPTNPTDPGTSGNPGIPGGSTVPGGSYPSSGGSWSGMGSMGGMGTSGSYPQVEQEPAFELYGMEMVEIAAVTPQDTMTMEITVDELDIKSLYVGMTAQIRIDVLGGEKCTAVISHIGNTGSGNGGNSKFTVELTMDRMENMLSGMNAIAKIVLGTMDQVLTIPADALVEEGNQTLVYTGYDEENEMLMNPVVVQTGVSDGETVQILDGLADGQTYYYAYYDTLEISYTPDFGGGGFMFGR